MADDVGHIIKIHEDIITVPEAMTLLYNQYKERGYRIHLKLPSSFSFYEDDNFVKLVYWKEGKIYEGLTKYKALKKIGRSIKKVDDALKKQIIVLLEMNSDEEAKVNTYLANHKLSDFLDNYEALDLSTSTNQKIDTIKLLIE